MCKFREPTDKRRRPYHSIMHTALRQSQYTRAIIILVALSGSGSFMTLHSIGGGISGQTIVYANKGKRRELPKIYPNVRLDSRQFKKIS